ncbi:MAG: hypothetical protein MK137_04305 [Rickettsiales bacterium]|nr:hypothetical protein [Rickettsiales bacterium]
MSYPLIFGHRGCMGDNYPPENTLAAFQYCLDHQIDGIELDVHASLDNELIVHHDTTLKRMTGADLDIITNEADTIRKHSVKGEIIPTLDETFELITPHLEVNSSFIVNIELKSTQTAEALYGFLERQIGSNGWKYSNIIVSSFDHELLKEIHANDSQIPIGALWDDKEHNHVEDIIKRLGFKPFSIHPIHNQCDDDYLSSASQHGIHSILWGVDGGHETSQDDASLLLRKSNHLPLHAIITNFPDIYSTIRATLPPNKPI